MKKQKRSEWKKENRIRWGGRKIRMAASISQQCWNAAKSVGVLLYPRRGGAPRRLAFREEDRIGKICCMKLIGLDAQEYEYNFLLWRRGDYRPEGAQNLRQ